MSYFAYVCIYYTYNIHYILENRNAQAGDTPAAPASVWVSVKCTGFSVGIRLCEAATCSCHLMAASPASMCFLRGGKKSTARSGRAARYCREATLLVAAQALTWMSLDFAVSSAPALDKGNLRGCQRCSRTTSESSCTRAVAASPSLTLCCDGHGLEAVFESSVVRLKACVVLKPRYARWEMGRTDLLTQPLLLCHFDSIARVLFISDRNL